MALVGYTGLCAPSVFIGRPIQKIWHTFSVMTWFSDLETGAHYWSFDGQHSYQFWCLWDFLFSNYGPTPITYAPCDIMTLIFDLGVHGTCWWSGSLRSICLQSLRCSHWEDMTLSVTCAMWFQPANFGLTSPFILELGWSMRQTDRRTDRNRASLYNAPDLSMQSNSNSRLSVSDTEKTNRSLVGPWQYVSTHYTSQYHSMTRTVVESHEYITNIFSQCQQDFHTT